MHRFALYRLALFLGIATVTLLPAFFPASARVSAVLTWEGPVHAVRADEIVVDDEVFPLSPSVVVYDRRGKRTRLDRLRKGMNVQLVYRGPGQPVIVINIR